jgi:hypothetical protein
MKRIISVIFAAIIFTSVANTQNSTSFGFDKEVVLADLNEYVRFVGADSDGFYALRINEKDELFLDFFNANSMSRENTNQLILPMISGIKAEYVEMYYLDSKLVLFSQGCKQHNQGKDSIHPAYYEARTGYGRAYSYWQAYKSKH